VTSGPGTAPLAIAAAAIAASQSVTQNASSAAAPAQTKTDPGAAGTAVTSTVPAVDPTASVAVAAAQTTASDAPAVHTSTPAASPSPAPTSPQAGADPALTAAAIPAAVAAPTPVAPKAAPLKGPAAGPAASPTPDHSDTPAADTNPLAKTVLATAADKQDSANGPANPAGVDVSASSASPPAAPESHPHSADTTNPHAATDLPDANMQATGAIQPQWSAAATAAAPAAALTATAAASVAVPLSGLALEIAASAKNGKSSFEIRLDPAELGRIDVRIDVDRNGQMTSHLTVEKPETLSMLQQDAPQLQRALDNAGFRTGDGGLQFSLRDQSSSGSNSGNAALPNAQRLIITDDDAIPAAVAGRTYGRMPGSGSGVDIRV
jgi:flagellar hook-length control protein FliK